MKKRLFISSILMTLVLLVAITTATFAWYKASNTGSAAGNVTATGTLSASNQTVSLGQVKINVAVHTGFDDNKVLVLTNMAGRSYYVVGGNATEIMADDFSTGNNHKQGTATFDVTITGRNAADTEDVSLTADMLAGVQGTYIVSVAASGAVKLALAKTSQASELGTSASSASVNFTAPAQTATGALGQAASQSVNVMKITIDSNGSVLYWTNASASFSGDGTAWALANLGTAVQTSAVFFGLEVKNATAEEFASIELGGSGDSKLTPAVNKQ